MKKLLLIMVILISIKGKSQAYRQHDIGESNSDTVTIGDTAWVDVAAQDGYYDPACADSFLILINSGLPGNLPVVIKKGYCQWNNTFPKYREHIPGGVLFDSTVRYTFIVPSSAMLGNNRYYGSNQKFVYVKPKITAGISEYVMPKQIREIHYYNELGQEIQKPSESTNGLVICRIIYSTGETNVTKKYYTNIY